MTALGCDVASCIHNADHYCCKGAILVEGNDAKEADDTFCASFVEKTEDSFRNTYDTPDYFSEIECEAVNCIHNEDCECQADRVGICGGKHCGCNEDTACSSFRCNG